MALSLETQVDHKHMGVGGDNSWDPSVHAEYLIRAGVYQWTTRMVPLQPGSSLNGRAEVSVSYLVVNVSYYLLVKYTGHMCKSAWIW